MVRFIILITFLTCCVSPLSGSGHRKNPALSGKLTCGKLLPVIRLYTRQYTYYVKSRAYTIHPALICGVIKQESGFNPRARSHADARGLMQIIPRTARLLGADPEKLFDAEYNLRYGIQFLAALLTEHKGDLIKTLSGYNGGSDSTEKRSVPGFEGRLYDNPETKQYVKKVLEYYEHYKNALRK